MTRYECPKCHAPMEAGFTIERDQGAAAPARWADGPPTAGWFGVKMKGKKQWPIETYRCVKCGFLESYAHETVQ